MVARASLRDGDTAIDRVFDGNHGEIAAARHHVVKCFTDVVNGSPILPLGFGNLAKGYFGECAGGPEIAVGSGCGGV
jgi:hypothetical protein